MRKLKRFVLPAILLSGMLSACGGGGNTLSDAIDDVTKGVFNDSYEDSCGSKSVPKNVNLKVDELVSMSIRVKTTGDVEPLSGEWFTEGDGWRTVLDTQTTPELKNEGDGTGRFFKLSLPVKQTGEMTFRLLIKDKKGEKRYEDWCSVHVNII